MFTKIPHSCSAEDFYFTATNVEQMTDVSYHSSMTVRLRNSPKHLAQSYSFVSGDIVDRIIAS